mmetsp:Transcript_17033/g.38890  ORF Transcript_17033/g.38890 Transcript_17033/m.38890 type:complete len:494 (-) Transcript_17033:585-2066(-)
MGISDGYKPVVVLGKIIVDEYGDPHPPKSNGCDRDGNANDDEKGPPAPPETVSIGGAGPQAAFGAAAALAVWDSYYKSNESEDSSGESGGDRDSNKTKISSKPPPVLLVAPVGKDWTPSDTSALESALGAPSAKVVVHNNTVTGCDFGTETVFDGDNGPVPIIETHLLQSRIGNRDGGDEKDGSEDGYFTPRIRFWHDRDQVVHWYAINDSFGPKGADGLWRNRPSSQDLATILDGWCGYADSNTNGGSGSTSDGSGSVVLHVVPEAGETPPGGGMDWLPLVQDERLLLRESGEPRLAFVGLEPQADLETIRDGDAVSTADLLGATRESLAAVSPSPPVLWCPDRALDEAIRERNLYERAIGSTSNYGGSLTVAVRDGPRGSKVTTTRGKEPGFDSGDDCAIAIPVATLSTEDAKPVNPTGAGNAYAGAMTSLLGNGVSLEAAACLATGIGAVVCEHEGLPACGNGSDWARVLDRIRDAAKEVESKLVLAKRH